MDQPFETVLLGLALGAVVTVLLVIEYLRAERQLRQRPVLPADDQPPRALRVIRASEVPGEVSRGMARLIGELREAAQGR